MTTSAIERDFALMLSQASIGAEIGGKAYRWAYRPRLSREEDVCVKLASGEPGQTQTGVVAVAAFYSDLLLADGSSVPDPERGAALEEALMAFPSQTRSSRYRIEPYGSPMHLKDEGTGQHFVSAKYKFKILTD